MFILGDAYKIYDFFFGWIELPKSRKEEKERKETDKFTMKPYTLKQSADINIYYLI